jgi:hypothetical protein
MPPSPSAGSDPSVAIATLGTMLRLGEGLYGVIQGQTSSIPLEKTLPWSNWSGLNYWH